MSRSQIRENIFKLLFCSDFNERGEMEGQVDYFFASGDIQATPTDTAYIRAKLAAILACVERLDALLAENIEGWELGRIGKVDLAILRLAIYEMLYDDEIDDGVAINEAVVIARKYGQENSRAFVNGVLSKFTEARRRNG